MHCVPLFVLRKSPEALAKRIWMSFVPEGHYALTLADLKEVMGPELDEQAEECFRSLDRDDNGDVSLEEMILHTVQLHSERRDVAKSMQDVVSTCVRFLASLISPITPDSRITPSGPWTMFCPS
jgi:Ca2+-binding EF-hand superfamily protein